MAKETYEQLIFQLGDLAREHLAEDPTVAPRAMATVFDAEDVVLAVRDHISAAEEQLNAEAADYDAFVAEVEAERVEQRALTAQYAAAVAGVERQTRALRKAIASQAAELGFQKRSFKTAEARHADLEQREGNDLKKLAQSAENVKKLRVQLMRDQRRLDDAGVELAAVLTPREDQPGAPGILAHKRLLELDDEAAARKEQHDALMKELDETLGAKEIEAQAAEAALDAAVFALGEAVFASRLAHPRLSSLYARLEKAR